MSTIHATALHAQGPRPIWSRLKPHMTWVALLAPSLLFLLALFIYPVVQVLFLSIKEPSGAFTAANYIKLASSPVYVHSLWVTFLLAFWTTAISVIGGYPIAYLLASGAPRLRQKILILVMLPFWTSFLVRSFAWMVLLGRQGAINDFLMKLGLIDRPLALMYNYTGALVGMVHALMPLFILAAAPVMSRIDRNVVNAAATLGAGTSQSFWRIYFPLSLPGVAAGGILVFVSALGFFITPSLLGGRQETVITRMIIREVQEGMNWGFSGALSVLLLVTALIFFVIYDRVAGLSTLTGEGAKQDGGASATGRRITAALAVVGDYVEQILRRVMPLRADRPQPKVGGRVLGGLAILVLGFLILPILFVIPVSFTKQSFLGWPPVLWSWQWYERFLESPLWLPATIRSVIVGIASGALATVLGTLAALALNQRAMRWRGLWLALLILPMMVPRVILSVGLFYLFAPLGLVGSLLGVILAHTVLALPYVVITVMAVLKDYDLRLDHAAWTMGAWRWQTFRRVQLPLIQGGVVAAFLFGFVTSFDDLTVALFVTAGLTSTLPKEMWDAATMQVNPELAAVSTVTLGIVLLIVLCAERLRSRGAPGA